MNISIIGTGYVGLCTGVGFAKMGNNVICMDVDGKKIKHINKAKPPIYEKQLKKYLEDVTARGVFRATTDLTRAITNSDLTMICVGTPSNQDGSMDLKYIEQVSKDIGTALKNKEGYHVIVVKSTVVPGTAEINVIPNLEEKSGKGIGDDIGMCVNPEFLREGNALEDFLNPDRIVIGQYDKRSGDVLEKIYSNFNAPVLRTNLKTAEMIKYASNALLATKISLSNEIGNICKRLGIDVYDVMKGVGMDSRISSKFLRAGAGFGGSCFPKDIAAIIAKGRELGQEVRVLEGVLGVNQKQRKIIVDMLEGKVGNLQGKKVGILGLAFKPDSDDVRDAPAIDVISMLKERGAKVSAYDPQAMDNMRKMRGDIEYCSNSGECLKDADGCLILTDWKEFKNLSDKDFDVMKNKVIIEGRKVLNPSSVKNFEGICWPGRLAQTKSEYHKGPRRGV